MKICVYANMSEIGNGCRAAIELEGEKRSCALNETKWMAFYHICFFLVDYDHTSTDYRCCVHKSNGYEYDDILRTLFGTKNSQNLILVA